MNYHNLDQQESAIQTKYISYFFFLYPISKVFTSNKSKQNIK